MTTHDESSLYPTTDAKRQVVRHGIRRSCPGLREPRRNCTFVAMSPDALARFGPRMSRRLPWHEGENRLAAATEARRARGLRIVDLTESNPSAVGLGAEPDALADALAGPDVREALAHHAPSARGSRDARVAIAWAASSNTRRAGTPGSGPGALEPDRLLLTASSSESYGMLFKLLGDPGDEVLVPEPSYPLFDYLVRLEGLGPRPYRLAFDGAWHLDLASVTGALDAAARARRRVAALVVVSPHNPTGAVLTRAELDALDDVCAARGIALVADQVFADYVHAPRPEHLGLVASEPTRATTFTLGGLSKSCGLPQLKLGWIAVGGPAAAAELALGRLELIADTYFSVSGPVQAARRGYSLWASTCGRALPRAWRKTAPPCALPCHQTRR